MAYSLGGPVLRPSATQTLTNENFLSNLSDREEIVKNPDVMPDVIENYPESEAEMLLGVIGGYKVANRGQVHHFETERPMPTVKVAAQAVGAAAAGDSLTLTVAASDMYVQANPSAQYNTNQNSPSSPVRVGGEYLLPDAASAKGYYDVTVTSVDRTTNPHTFVIEPNQDTVQLSAVAADTELISMGISVAERSDAVEEMSQRLRHGYANLVMMRETGRVTDRAMATELNFKQVTTPSGAKGYFATHQHVSDAYKRLQIAITRKLLVGEMHSNADIDAFKGDGYASNEGAITWTKKYGIDMTYAAGALALADFDNLTSQLRAEQGAMHNALMVGHDFRVQINKIFGDETRNKSFNAVDRGTGLFARLNFEAFDINGFIFNVKDFLPFNDPTSIGNSELPYNAGAWLVPQGQIANPAEKGAMQNYLCLRYHASTDTGGQNETTRKGARGFYEWTNSGGFTPGGNDGKDGHEYYIKADIGNQQMCPQKFAVISEA